MLQQGLLILRRAIPTDYAAWIGFSLDPHPAVTTFIESEPRASAESARRLAEGILDHPFARHYASRRRPEPLRWSDIARSERERHIGRFRDVYQDLGVEHLLGVPVVATSTELLGVSLVRTRRDFSDGDRTRLGLLQPHLAIAYQTGRIVRTALVSGPEPVAFDATTFGLSARERDVGLWMMHGKTNAEIALILGIGRRTVEKHVERLFDKLGVANRAGAVLILRRINAAQGPPA